MSGDSLGDRMKAQYENRTRYSLPRRTYTILRVDGKAFHSYTRDCERPFDTLLMEDMDFTAKAMCEQIQGAKLAYVQSDEISLVLTDFDTLQTDAWFDGSIQKMASISASIATAAFNAFRLHRLLQRAENPREVDLSYGCPRAMFDSRVFTIPDPEEVTNYLIWRQQDATTNSIQMVAQCHFPQSELQGKSVDQLQEMLWSAHGINWNDFPTRCKRGGVVVPRVTEKTAVFQDPATGETRTVEGVQRRAWEVETPPLFSRDRDWLRQFIPRQTP